MRLDEYALTSTSPRMKRPFTILASSQDSIAYGEVIDLRLTLVNPTNDPIALPDDKLGMINGMLSAEWALDGIEEGYFTGCDISSFMTSTPESGRHQLAPGEMVDYQIRWRSTCEDVGRIDLEVSFKFNGEQSCMLRLRSLGRANKTSLSTPAP